MSHGILIISLIIKIECLSIVQDIRYQHFIEFVETDDREVKENISFQGNASKFGMLLSTCTNIYCQGWI